MNSGVLKPAVWPRTSFSSLLRGAERQAEVLGPLHHVAQIDVVGVDVDPPEPLDEASASPASSFTPRSRTD